MCLHLHTHPYLVHSQQAASVQVRQIQPIAAMTTAVKMVHSANLGSLKSGRTHEILGLGVHMNLAKLGTSKAISDLLTYCLSLVCWGGHESEQASGSIFVWELTCYIQTHLPKHARNKSLCSIIQYLLIDPTQIWLQIPKILAFPTWLAMFSDFLALGPPNFLAVRSARALGGMSSQNRSAKSVPSRKLNAERKWLVKWWHVTFLSWDDQRLNQWWFFCWINGKIIRNAHLTSPFDSTFGILDLISVSSHAAWVDCPDVFYRVLW